MPRLISFILCCPQCLGPHLHYVLTTSQPIAYCCEHQHKLKLHRARITINAVTRTTSPNYETPHQRQSLRCLIAQRVAATKHVLHDNLIKTTRTSNLMQPLRSKATARSCQDAQTALRLHHSVRHRQARPRHHEDITQNETRTYNMWRTEKHCWKILQLAK